MGGRWPSEASRLFAEPMSPSTRNRFSASRSRSSAVGPGAAVRAARTISSAARCVCPASYVSRARRARASDSSRSGPVAAATRCSSAASPVRCSAARRCRVARVDGPRPSVTAALTNGWANRTDQPAGVSRQWARPDRSSSSTTAPASAPPGRPATARHGRDEGERRAVGHHRRGSRQRLGRRAQAGQLSEHGARERLRRGQGGRVVGERGLGGLDQEGAEVERVAVGVPPQAYDGAGGDVVAVPAHEVRDLAVGQPGQPQPVVIGGHQPQKSLREPDDVVLRRGHHQQHAVRPKPAHRERQRLERGGVGEVGVVDDEDRDGAVRPAVEDAQAGRPRRRTGPPRFGRGRRSAAAAGRRRGTSRPRRPTRRAAVPGPDRR